MAETSAGFTLRSDKAREKLKKFALAHPENYFLLTVGALYTLGGRHLDLKVDADDLELASDANLRRGELTDFWGLLAGDSKQESGEALRLLALSILTSSRFESVDWELSATDREGGFCYRQSIRKGDVAPARVTPLEAAPGGVTVKVKRRALGQVARRFFSHLKGKLLAREMLEQRVLSERVFLGAFERFRFNGRDLPCLPESLALAVSRTGRAPNVVEAEFEFRSSGDISVLAVVTAPRDLAELPGVKGRIGWIWHGLTMGTSDLNLPFEFCRAFVVADHLPTDLGLTALPDGWEKSRAERAARDAMRDLLHNLTLEFLRNQDPSRRESWDRRLEEILLQVIGHRIQITRSRHRLAKFNRDLVACPLFWGSACDGSERRYTLAEIWERMETGREVACFEPGEESFLSVPPWPDRPLVVLGDELVIATLRSVFGAKSLLDAKRVAKNIRELLGKIEKGSSRQEPRANDGVTGKLLWRGHSVAWTVGRDSLASEPGEIQVEKEGRPYFREATLGLPPGLQVSGNLGWEPDYKGRLKDRESAFALCREVLESMADFLSSHRGRPLSADEAAVARVLWDSMLGEDPLFGERMPAEGKAWLPVYLPGLGWTRQSPSELLGTSSAIPIYWLPIEEVDRFRPPGEEASYLFLARDCVPKVKKYSQRPVFYGKTLERFLSLPPVDISPREYWVESLNWRGYSILVGFPNRGLPGAIGLRLLINLRGHGLKSRALNGLIKPVVVSIALDDGWPNGKLDGLTDASLTEALESALPQLVLEAAHALFEKADPAELARLDPVAVSLAWFECWTCDDSRERALFPLACGGRISAAQVARTERIFYFTDLDQSPCCPPGESVLWVPPEVVDTLELMEGSVEWVAYQKKEAGGIEPSEEPRREKSPGPVSDFRPKPPVIADESKESGISCKEVSSSLSTETTSEEPFEMETEEEKRESPSVEISPETADRLPGSSPLDPREALLAQLRALDLLEHDEIGCDFEHYLRRLTWNDEGELLSADGKLSLSTPGGAKACSDEFSILLLSALFSVFNRDREDVEDRHERFFHRALLKRCEELFVKRPKSSA